MNVKLIIFAALVIATVMEVCGDALMRIGLNNPAMPIKIGCFVAGGLLLAGYGLFLNLAPIEFGRVVGVYIATLFVVWQIGNYFIFKTVPTVPILIGGSLIILGGLIVAFWSEPAASLVDGNS